MKRSYVLPPLIAAALVVSAGVVSGLWSDRWMQSSELQHAVERMSGLPMTIGGWQGHDEEIEPEQVAQAQLAGYVFRRYQRGRDVVTLLLVCGRPGPITRHTPDVCYSGAGFEFRGTPEKLNNPQIAPPGTFWTLTLHKPQATGTAHLRILWSWNATGTWEAADNPRLQFARNRALYKLYLIQELDSAEAPMEGSALAAFTRELMPVLERTLFPAHQ